MLTPCYGAEDRHAAVRGGEEQVDRGLLIRPNPFLLQPLTKPATAQRTLLDEGALDQAEAALNFIWREALASQSRPDGNSLRRRGQRPQPRVILGKDQVESAAVEPRDEEGAVLGQRRVHVSCGDVGDTGAQGESPGVLVLGLNREQSADPRLRATIDGAIQQLRRGPAHQKLALVYGSRHHNGRMAADGLARHPEAAPVAPADNGAMPDLDPPTDTAADDANAEYSADAPADPFEDLVFAALDSLPAEFRDRLGTVAVVVEDEATPEQLASVGAGDLFGLYTGVPRTAWGAGEVPLASKITIFRGPHLRHYRTIESLVMGVTDTVHHEVAHHFGISDTRLEELARERRDRL
jgi:predicted Zn-dependent protease with MMP-like domain